MPFCLLLLPAFQIKIPRMMSRRAVLGLLLLLSFMSISVAVSNAAGLTHNFYKDSCPDAEEIVTDVVKDKIFFDFRNSPRLLRLQFHDCFVTGCDASILLDATPSGEMVEKQEKSQDTVHGYDVIEDAKAELEKKCPGVVSCADVVIFAVRDAIVSMGLEHFPVVSGRRDRRASLASNVEANLPGAYDSVEMSAKLFASKGFSLDEMVILLGSHSTGVAHCPSFDKRLDRNSNNKYPEMDTSLKWMLKFQCPAVTANSLNPNLFVFLTPMSSGRLSNSYYNSLLSKTGVLASDQALTEYPPAEGTVKALAESDGVWRREFVKAMQKLGTVGVLTGNQGEIRRKCSRVN